MLSSVYCIKASAWGIELEELDAFFQIRGGEEFQKLYKRAQKLHSSKETMIAAGTKLENRILRFGAGDLSITGRKAEKDPKSLWKGRIVWSQPLRTGMKSWRTAYEQLAEQYHLEWKEFDGNGDPFGRTANQASLCARFS